MIMPAGKPFNSGLACYVDFTGLFVLPLAAIITAAWVIGGAVLRRGRTFCGPFLLSYFLAVLLMKPWQIASWQEAGMAVVMFIMVAIPVACGCAAGGISAILLISLVRRLAHIRDI